MYYGQFALSSHQLVTQVNEEPTVGEEAYVWFGSVFPLACDVVNARFTFEALTATTANGCIILLMTDS